MEESAKTLDDWYWVAGEMPRASSLPDAVIEALADDLNTPQMIAVIAWLAQQARLREMSAIAASSPLRCGFSVSCPRARRNGSDESSRRAASMQARVDGLIADRTAARARKDFKESDRIRDELAAMGVVIKDSKEGTTWEIAR